jgi:hypothetical protein
MVPVGVSVPLSHGVHHTVDTAGLRWFRSFLSVWLSSIFNKASYFRAKEAVDSCSFLRAESHIPSLHPMSLSSKMICKEPVIEVKMSQVLQGVAFWSLRVDQSPRIAYRRMLCTQMFRVIKFPRVGKTFTSKVMLWTTHDLVLSYA